MTTIDIVLAVPLAFAIYRGFKRGLILELAMLVGLVLGIYLGIHFSKAAAEFLKETFNANGPYLPILSFATVFVLVLIMVYFIGKLMEKTADLLMLGLLNKILGAFFGVIKMGMILSFFLFFLNSFSPSGSIISKSMAEKSYLYKTISSFAPVLLPKIKAEKQKMELRAV
jgi:membrane protein required for colicin V production